MNIYNKIPRKILMFVYDDSSKSYMTSVAKKLDATYCHLQRVVSILEKEKFIRTSKNGRRRFVVLTQKGINVVELFKKIEKVICK